MNPLELDKDIIHRLEKKSQWTFKRSRKSTETKFTRVYNPWYSGI